MSRTLIAIIALLGLSLGSCSSSPSASELGINPDIDTSNYNPRPSGMTGTGTAFDKYWMAYNANDTYSGFEESDPWYHFMTPWNWGDQDTFGDATVRGYRPYADMLERPNPHAMFHKWALNDDINDPYHD